ncbi:MAG: hypothetical protein AB9880_11415 [Christensenellales bacterium]
MNRITSWILALILALGIGANAFASTPDNSGPPDFDVSTEITPGSLTVYQDESVAFTAVTTFTSNKNDNQWLHFVRDEWTGVDVSTPAAETALTVVADPAAQSNERQQVFTATASVLVSKEPGDYDVYVTYTITLQHDFSGMRTYKTVTTTVNMLITVLEGTADAEVIEETPTQGGLLNHGQIVSAWAHWKQTKGNENFLAGGPGVYRSLVWYKTQVEYREFTSVQQVYDYLDSIYEPENRHNRKDKKDKKDNQGNNSNRDNPGKGN